MKEDPMKVFVAGGTGAIGRRLVPLLTGQGHDVFATTRAPEKAAGLRAAGAIPVVVDALDREALHRAVLEAEPEVVVHQLTALSSGGSPRRFDSQFEATNRLRTEGTDNLVQAAVDAGARRFVAQSYAGWPYAREGGPAKSEDASFDPQPPRQMRRSLDAIRHLEEAVLETPGLEGVVLRYGTFYGPGTAIAHDGDLVGLVRRRRLPVVGSGTGVWSFVHVDDAAAATALAIEPGAPTGIFNVVDDDPAPVCEWLPELADAVGAEPPRRVPALLGRLAIGEAGISLMTSVRGAGNARARDELGWRPRHESWRRGFRSGLGVEVAAGR
jgi:nucleoside-diphosphate-sugar epimerase